MYVSPFHHFVRQKFNKKKNEELGLANMTMPDVRMDVDIHLGSIQLITAKIIRRDSYFTTL